jgi:hypothetical protein
LCFNIPAAYLLEADEPGGGGDPSLLSLPARLAELRSGAHAEVLPELPVHTPLSTGGIGEWLDVAGLRADSWCFRVRITQDAYAEWLKIPVLTDQLLGGLSPQERARQIDSALRTVDRSSWRWERWRGWTAWKD